MGEKQHIQTLRPGLIGSTDSVPNSDNVMTEQYAAWPIEWSLVREPSSFQINIYQKDTKL